MTIPPATLELAERQLRTYCEQRVPPEVRDQVRVGHRVEGDAIILVEERPVFLDPTKWITCPVARIEYDTASAEWDLWAFDRDDEAMPYSMLPTKNLEAILAEIDEDPTSIFWG